MKKVIRLIMLAFIGAVSASAAISEKAVCDTTDVDLRGGLFPWGGGDRGLIINELRVSVVSFVDNYFVVVTVLQNLGQMDFCITNTNTGEFLDGEINALPGSYPIPISGTLGYYTVLFTLPDGRSLYGTFEL